MPNISQEDRELFRTTAADFVQRESPVARLRALRDAGDEAGFSREMWSRMAELGWQGLLISEEHGGMDMGFAEMACVLQEAGRTLVPEPLVSSLLLGAGAVTMCGTDKQRSELLPAVADGTRVLSLAWAERGARFDPTLCRATAVAGDEGYTITGEKLQVATAHAADCFIVSARTSGGDNDANGISLFVVPADTPGIEIGTQRMLDSSVAGVLRLNSVVVEPGALLGLEPGVATPALRKVLDAATAGLCAEMVGATSAAFEITLDYLRTRKQFGTPIGAFQALKHRASELFVELELAKSSVEAACAALDSGDPDAPTMISVAKARCSDCAASMGYEAVQMHGGIGMTDEHDIGLYLKYLRMASVSLGDAAWHRERFATLSGF